MILCYTHSSVPRFGDLIIEVTDKSLLEYTNVSHSF